MNGRELLKRTRMRGSVELQRRGGEAHGPLGGDGNRSGRGEDAAGAADLVLLLGLRTREKGMSGSAEGDNEGEEGRRARGGRERKRRTHEENGAVADVGDVSVRGEGGNF